MAIMPEPATPASAPAFDPDAFLKESAEISAPKTQEAFDPDAFLRESAGAAPTPKNYDWTDVPLAAAKNAPSSALKLGENLVQPFIHPIETGEAIKNLGHGVLQKAGVLGGDTHKQYAEAAWQGLKEKYGSIENFKRSLAEDPIGVMADLSLALTGGGAALRGAGKVAELAGATRAELLGLSGTGRGLQTAGAYTDPLNLVGKGASWLAKVEPEQKLLEKAGVEMTPGHLLSGRANVFKTTEDAATSVPGTGYFIKSAHERSVKSFNEAVGRQPLAPLKELASQPGQYLFRSQNLPSSTGVGTVSHMIFKKPEYYDIKKGTAGHDMVREVESKLGEAYNQLLPRISMVPDKQFTNDIGRIFQNAASSMPHSQASLLQRIVFDRIHGPDPVPGKRIKEVESQLGSLARRYSGSADAGQQILGEKLHEVIKAIRSNIERSNPAWRKELEAINFGWAQYARIRDAAQRRVTSNGVFLPSDLLQAIRRGDNTVQHGSFAKGEALMQKFAEAGQKVLPSSVADSGTATRLAVQHLITGGTLGGGAAYLGNPAIMGVIAGASLPYTKAGMWALNKGLRPIARSPKTARAISNATYWSGRVGNQEQPPNPYAP